MTNSPIVTVIDDEAPVRRATSSLLRAHGYRVLTFVSAEEFLASAIASEADCILSDVQMKGMSGIDLFTHLRHQDRHTPFVFMTAFPDIPMRARLGDDICVLPKPFRAEDLVSCIERAIGGTAANA